MTFTNISNLSKWQVENALGESFLSLFCLEYYTNMNFVIKIHNIVIFTPKKVEETQETKSARKVASSSHKEETTPAPARRSSRLKPSEEDIEQG